MKCIDCVHYPWKVDTDPGVMPPMKCHPKLSPGRWTLLSVKSERHCPMFEGNEDVRVDLVDPDNYTAKQLREMADEMGIQYKNGATKPLLARLINEHLKG